MSKLLLGIDIGTSACKVAIFDLKGKVLSQSTKEYKVYYPAPGYVEQNPIEWWESICAAIKETIVSARINSSQIAGIGIDGQSWSAIPINKEGKVLHNNPIWMDTRAEEICKETVNRVGFDKIFSLSGNSFEPTYTTPKILWFKKNMPDVYNATYKFLQSNSFIAFKLTGRITQDISQGYGVHSFNINEGKWDDSFCEKLGFDREKLPEIYQCDEVIGEVTAEAAALTSLAKGTPVVAGGLDACCGTLGAGVINVGQTQEQGGQAGGMSICLDSAIVHPKLILGFHVIPNMWLLQGGTVGGGGAMKWFRQEFGAYEEAAAKAAGTNVFNIMDDEAEQIKAGSEGVLFLPYMAGERSPLWDKNAKGVFFGLNYTKTRAHMIRAVMEGCAFALQHNLKTAEEIGVGVNELVAMGGAANSQLWTQIKADVTGKTIKVPTSDIATTLGAAILAGVGTGQYSSFEQAVKDTIVITKTYEPNLEIHKEYQRGYEIYLELYEKLKGTMHKYSN
jgi:xylulokinase